MNTIFEPMQAMLLGGWEIILIVFVSLFCVVVVPVCGVVAIVYFVSNRSKNKAQPAPAVPAVPATPVTPASASPLAAQPPVALKTEVMPRKCPQCGAVLQPDTPEGLCPACLLQRGFATEAGAPSAQSAFVPPPIDELARLFPQLEIMECLGRGGMGAVYKARQPRLDRLVALKILAPEKQNDPQFAERFEREARVLARLSHPNIVSVFDFGEVQGRFYLIMEFVDGLTLRQVMQAGRVSPAEALELVPKICDALQYAHGQGIVHRDIKPENILLDKQGRVKIADFGIAKIAGLEATGLSLTGARDVMGTPHYMAPEQVETPQTVDHRADIYSLGVVFYEMLTGELPLGKFAPPSKKVHVDVRLDEVVLHALEKEPSRRYQQASQVKTAVETISGTPGMFAPALIAPVGSMSETSDKTILPAFLLAFFFGVFGAHRFYVGKMGTAVLQLCTCGGFGIWATIDWILIVCSAFTDIQGRRLTNWIRPDPGAQPAQALPAVGAAKPDRFWRGFTVVIASLIFIPIFLAVAGILLAIILPAVFRPHARADSYTALDLQRAGIQSEHGEFWKKSSQTFPLDNAGRFKIDNINGRIEIHGWNSNAVVLNTVIHGKNARSVDNVRFDINSDPGNASVHTGKRSREDEVFSLWDWLQNGGRNDATVDYIVQVPDHVRLDEVTSVNGRISIDGVAGDISATTVNGATKVKDARSDLKLKTINGTIAAEVVSLGEGQLIKLGAVNGTIDLALPEDARAVFVTKTLNGTISSEFPTLQPKKEFPVGHTLNGSLGQGGGSVKIETMNGSVKILKHPAAKLATAGAVAAPAADVMAESPVTNASPAAPAPVVSAAQAWLELIDAGSYAESWKQAAAIFQGALTEPEWEKSMNTFRKPLGKVTSRVLKAADPFTKLPGAPDGQYLVIQFETSFAEKTSAVETVTFNIEKDGQWKSSGYFIK